MFIQISFCVLVLLMQVVPHIPPTATLAGAMAVLFIAGASGFDYVLTWTVKAMHSRTREE
jgi:hypothetical protein